MNSQKKILKSFNSTHVHPIIYYKIYNFTTVYEYNLDYLEYSVLGGG